MCHLTLVSTRWAQEGEGMAFRDFMPCSCSGVVRDRRRSGGDGLGGRSAEENRRRRPQPVAGSDAGAGPGAWRVRGASCMVMVLHDEILEPTLGARRGGGIGGNPRSILELFGLAHRGRSGP